MRYTTTLVIMFAAFAGAAACASNQGSASTPVATARELGELPQPKWVASIRANVTDRLAADSTRERMNGSLVWMPSGSPDMSTARIEFAYTGSARELTWGIFFGPCGNASLPVVTLSDFPELEMSSGGRTQLVASVSTELPTTGAFHVEIFKDRSGLPEFSIACGNMRFSRG